MEVRIGIQQSAREIVLESTQTPDQVTKAVTAALSGGVLDLTDEKGRRVLVPGEKLAYVEIGASEARKVGFGGA